MKVGIIMGSDSDLKIMQQAEAVLHELGVETEMDVMSAHRTPERVLDYARGAYQRGVAVIIAGAGGAAHLAGFVAAVSAMPVIAVPIKSSNSLDGWDSILSMLQMPSGVPVATVALDGARNAGILAAQILSVADPQLHQRIVDFKEAMKEKVYAASARVREQAK